jgi:hypothetical protein
VIPKHLGLPKELPYHVPKLHLGHVWDMFENFLVWDMFENFLVVLVGEQGSIMCLRRREGRGDGHRMVLVPHSMILCHTYHMSISST